MDLIAKVRKKREIRQMIRSGHPLNVVLGSGEYIYEGWVPTEKDTLDITSPKDWAYLFTPGSIDRLLCEHVLEHLEPRELLMCLQLCHIYLKPLGLLRIAVPDMYRKDPDYVADVSPPKDGHKARFTVDNLSVLLGALGFAVTPLEYYDKDDHFHHVPWSANEGMVIRSMPFYPYRDFKRDDHYYTSLIVDARKPK